MFTARPTNIDKSSFFSVGKKGEILWWAIVTYKNTYCGGCSREAPHHVATPSAARMRWLRNGFIGLMSP
jgi:hypothetical protein